MNQWVCSKIDEFYHRKQHEAPILPRPDLARLVGNRNAISKQLYKEDNNDAHVAQNGSPFFSSCLPEMLILAKNFTRKTTMMHAWHEVGPNSSLPVCNPNSKISKSCFLAPYRYDFLSPILLPNQTMVSPPEPP